MAKQDKKSSEAGKKMFNDVTDSSIDAKNAVDEFYKSLLKGGKKAQPVLDELSKLFSKTGDASAKASKKMKTVSEDLDELANTVSQGQKQFKSLQKTLATYDGPAFKAAGMITEELSMQLSYNEMLSKSKSSLNELDARSYAYSKLLSDSSKELVNIDNARYESINQLNDIKSKTNSLTGELIGLLQDESVLRDLQAENESKRFDLIQKINQEADPNVRNKLEDELLGYMQEGLDLEKEIFENKKNQVNVNDSLQASLETEANLNRNLQVLAENRLNTEKDIAFQSAINNDQTGKLKSTFENINEITNQQINSQDTLAKKMQEVEQSAFNVGTEQYRQIDLTDDINDKLVEQRNLEAARSNILDTNNGLTATQRQDALDLIDANIAINREQLNQMRALQAASEAYQSVNDKAKSLADTMSKPIDALFGIVPSGLSQMLGLDKIQGELKDKLFKSISDGFMGASGGVSGFFSAASAGASTLMTSLAPILPLLLAIAGVVGLVKTFLAADAAVGDLAKNLNISYQEGVKVYSTANDISGELGQFGIKTSDVTKQMTDLSNIMGVNLGTLSTTNAKAKEFLETSTLISKRYGTTAEENLALNSAAAVTGTSMDKMALTVEAMSKDGLIPAGELMKDIGKVSKGVLFNFKGNVVALAKAVKQAKLMGTTLDKMSAVGENLMNIESQIAAQNKARVMLGKNINMDAARYFYMIGDTEKMMDAMVQQMGSAAEYDKLGPYQRKLYAEAMGMGVDQLDEMMAKQLELEQIGLNQTELQDILNKSTEAGFDMQKALSKVSGEKAQDLLKEKILQEQNLSIQEKIAGVADKFKTALFKAIKPLLPAIERFANSLLEANGPVDGIFSTIKGIASVLGTVMEISMAILKGAWMPIKGIIWIISGVFNIISKAVTYIKEEMFGIKDATGEAGKAAEGTSKTMEVIKGIATAIGVIIGLWFAGKMIGKAVDGFKSMQTSIKDTYSSTKDMGKDLIDSAKGFKDGMKQAGDEGKGLFGKLKAGWQGMKKKSPVEEVTEKGGEKIDTPEVDTKGADKTLKNTKSFADKLKSAFKSINDTLKAIFKGIGDMLKNIFKFIKDTVKSVLDVIKSVMKDVFNTIKDVAKELTSTLQSLLQNIGDLLNTAIDVIKDVASNLIGAIDELLGSIIELIDSQGTALVEALGNIGNALAENVMKIVNTLLDGLGQAASKLPGIMNSLGQAIGSFFSGLSGGLVTFAQAMATPTILFGMPVGLILIGMAMGLAAAARIAAPAIAALGPMFEGLAKVVSAMGDVVASIGNAIATVITSIADSIVKFSDVDAGNIAAVGLSLGVLGAGLLALTAGEVVNGIASFFGASPVDTLKELETIDGNKMKTTADGLKSMSDALTNFGNVNTDPIVKSADALDKFNNQVIKGGLADGLNSFLGTDPFAVFNQLAAIDTAKIDSVAASIATAGTSIETFNQKMSALDDSVADKGDIISSLLNDIADIEYDEIDSLATAIDNLAKSYDTLMASMKSITDEDIARMQQITSATPKDVGGGGITDVISDTLGSAMSGVKDLASSAISSVGSFFGFGEEEPKQEPQVTQTKPAITPVMQEPYVVTSTVTAPVSEQQNQQPAVNDNKNVEALLKELISKVQQPVQIKIGDGPLRDIQSAISLSKSYTANINGFR